MIDRAEEGDGDAVRPARSGPVDAEPAEPGGAVLATPEQRAAASRRYQDTVDRTHDVARIEAGGQGGEAAEARDAWAEALPRLRAAWENHEQRYPERTRPTPTAQADGGWLADGGRRLSPEQNAEASKACEDIRAEGREVIRPAMERVEAADPDRRLAGLEHMLKGEDRLKEKIAERLRYNPDWTSEQALEEVPDAVRFSLAYSDDRYTDGVQTDVDRLKTEGFELVKLKNLWTKEQYKGINSQWCMPETGVRFEVQFHTTTSLEAKELTHKAYERLRNPATSAAEEAHLEDYQRRVNQQVPLPPRVLDIENYPPERRDG